MAYCDNQIFCKLQKNASFKCASKINTHKMTNGIPTGHVIPIFRFNFEMKLGSIIIGSIMIN